jgi:hypothetical protein
LLAGVANKIIWVLSMVNLKIPLASHLLICQSGIVRILQGAVIRFCLNREIKPQDINSKCVFQNSYQSAVLIANSYQSLEIHRRTRTSDAILPGK